MEIVRDIVAVRKIIGQIKKDGLKCGFVPTMGALHEGHLSLVRQAKNDCDFVAVSIFVNPAQFGPREDLTRYPRPIKRDVNLLKKEKTDLLFLPTAKTMYPPDFSTWVQETVLSRPLCGAMRPGHFKGVATVVAKLFNIVQPDIAYFGAKDFQQAQVIKRMVRDLDFPVQIKVVPTVRDTDALALSSRNAYLNAADRDNARVIPYSLDVAKRMILQNRHVRPARVIAAMKKLIQARKGSRIDYISICDADTLGPLERSSVKILVALAVFAGKTRLIDNVVVGRG